MFVTLTLLITCIPLSGFAEEDGLSKSIQNIKKPIGNRGG